MKCSNCNYNNKDNDLFCSKCGAKLDKEDNIIDKKNDNKEDDLLNIYIGKNFDSIKKGGFSFCTLFFGIFYTIYRKMWFLSLFWFLINFLIVYFCKNISYLIIFAISIVISIKFKDLYLLYAKRNIMKIKEENALKSYDEICNLCSKKGGVSLNVLIISIILYLILIIFNTYNVITKINTTKKINSLDELNILIPKHFDESSLNDDYLKSFLYDDENDFCTFNYSNYKANDFEVNEYIEKSIYASPGDTVSKIMTNNLNGNLWSYITVKNKDFYTYYYVIKYNDIIYNVEFKLSNNPSNYCLKSKDLVINSLNFK